MPPLKIRKDTLDAARKENLQDIVEGFVIAVEDGRFDAYVVELEEALSLRMARLQGMEAPPPLKLPQRAPEAPPEAEERPALARGDRFHLKGERYTAMVVEFSQHLADSPKHCRVLVIESPALVEGTEAGKYLRLPYAALLKVEKLDDGEIHYSAGHPAKSRPSPTYDSVTGTPYGHVSCRLCGNPMVYSGVGRPKKFCDKCKDKPTAKRINRMEGNKL